MQAPVKITRDILYRKYETADNTAIRELNVTAMEAAGAYIPGFDADFNDIEGIYMQGGGEFMVATPCNQDELVVAMGGFKVITAEIAELKRMRVHPAYQRRGIGRTMLSTLEVVAANRGFEIMQLDTRSVQVASQGLYVSAGYLELGRTVEEPFGEVIAYEKSLV